MSKASVPSLTLTQGQAPIRAPLGSLTVTIPASRGRSSWTLTGAQLAQLVSLAECRGFESMVDEGAINMELRGLAALARYAGSSETRYVDEEYAITLIERIAEGMAARLEASDVSARDYTVTIDPAKAVA